MGKRLGCSFLQAASARNSISREKQHSQIDKRTVKTMKQHSACLQMHQSQCARCYSPLIIQMGDLKMSTLPTPCESNTSTRKTTGDVLTRQFTSATMDNNHAFVQLSRTSLLCLGAFVSTCHVATIVLLLDVADSRDQDR